MADLSAILSDLALHYGYLGVFFASLAGSVIPFLPVPYLIVVVLLSNTLDPLVLGVAAGIGGALGKATSYFLGRSGYQIAGSGTKKNLEFLGRYIGKYGDLGVFIFAVSPLPDDVYLIPLGMVKFPFWRFMAINTAGKIILSTAVAYFGRSYFQLAGAYTGGDQLTLTVALVIFTLAASFLLARADWQLAHSRYKEGGGRRVFTSLPEILGLTRKSQEGSG